MTVQTIIIYVLLGIGVLGCLFTAIGLFFMEDAYEQVQFLPPASVIGAVAIPIAIVVKEGFNQGGQKAIAIAVLVLLANPVLSHATVRAARIRRKGQWPPAAEERTPVTKPAE